MLRISYIFFYKVLLVCNIFIIFAPEIVNIWTHYSEKVTGY